MTAPLEREPRDATEGSPAVDAIREALVNMLMHTDYFSPLKPRIRVFTDRIEFFNPGALPKPLNVIMREDLSLPRNPVLAKLFRVIKLAENAGFGFDKMMLGWKETGAEPLVETGIDYFKISFPLNGMKGSVKSSEKSSEKIISILRSRPEISAKEIASLVGISSRAVEKQLAKLKEHGVIKRTGPAKGGYWEVCEK